MLVRFLSRGFHNGSIVEPGEVITVSDDTRLGQHMVRLGGGDQPDGQPSAKVADLAYALDPAELRAQMTEDAIRKAEATRQREAEEEALRVAASVGEQPMETTDQGGDAADG